jgi:hypothetical protein
MDFCLAGRAMNRQVGLTSGQTLLSNPRKIKAPRGFSRATGPGAERGLQKRVEYRPRNEGIGNGFSRALQQFASG